MIRTFIITLVSLVLSSLFVSQGFCGFTVYSAELPPYHFIGDDQKIHGASVDILGEMMRRSGFAFDPGAIKYVPWARGMSETEQKEGALLIGVGRTRERERRFKWIGPYCSFKMGLVALKSRGIRIASPSDMLKYSIGVITNSASDAVLRSQYAIPQNMLVSLTDDTQQFRMLHAGRIDMVCHSDTGAPYSIKRAGLSVCDYEMVYALRNEFLYFAVNINTRDEVVQKLQRSLEDMRVANSSGISVVDSVMNSYKGINAFSCVTEDQ